jgi:Bacterial Ig domain
MPFAPRLSLNVIATALATALTTAIATGIVTGAAFVAPAAAQAPDVVLPILTCVEPVDDPSFRLRAHFGYVSTYSSEVTIPIGANNLFFPGAQNRGQPTTFVPGFHPRQFSTDWAFSASSAAIVWFMGTERAVANNHTGLLCNVRARGPWNAAETYEIADVVTVRIAGVAEPFVLLNTGCSSTQPPDTNACWQRFVPTPPVISPIADQTTPEDTPLPAIDVTLSDFDNVWNLTVTASTSDPLLIPLDGIVISGYGAHRTIRATPASNRAGSAEITLIVSDGLAATSETFIIVVTPVDDPPEISPVLDWTINEDGVTPPIAFTVADADTGAGSLTVVASASDPVLVPPGGIVVNGTSAGRAVSIAPAEDAFGTSTITLTVNDGALSASTSFTLNVLPVNDRPRIAPIANQTTTENTPAAPIAITITDVDNIDDDMLVFAQSHTPSLVSNDGIAISGSGFSRTMTITPLANKTGVATIAVLVSDGHSLATLDFLLDVTAAPSGPPATAYLAEGATGPFFDLDVLIANPHPVAVPVTIRFLTDAGVTVSENRTLSPSSRTTIRVDSIQGLEWANVSTLVTSPAGLPLIVERTMWWDASGYGAHTEKASTAAAPEWLFAEGAQGFFSTFFLFVNPHDTANTAHVIYLREHEPPLTRDYPMPPHGRVTVEAAADPDLINRAFGARVRFDQPGAAERAMYFGPGLAGGHASAGVTAPSREWLLAEGATGSFFTTFLLLANPGDTDAAVTFTYLPTTGIPVVRRRTIPALQRLTINIAEEDPSLADAAVATQVNADVPIVVERAQYWPQPAWEEAHNSFGEIAPGTRWGLAEGRSGGSNAAQTFILLANPGTEAAQVTITFLRTAGVPIVKTFPVPPTSRFTVTIAGPASHVPELTDEGFGAIIDSSRPIVVERAMYSNANGVTWAAGTNATATRLP